MGGEERRTRSYVCFAVILSAILIACFAVLKPIQDKSSIPVAPPGSVYNRVLASPSPAIPSTPQPATSKITEVAGVPVEGEFPLDPKEICLGILTQKSNRDKAVAIKETWGKHATILLFASDEDDPKLPAVKMGGDGRQSLGRKAMEMWYYMARSKETCKWFVMADDDTFMVIPNLYHTLRMLDPSRPKYMGYMLTHTKPYIIGGGGGIVMSRRSLEMMVESKSTACNVHAANGPGDTTTAQCMASLNISATDVKGFYAFLPDNMIGPNNFCDITWWVPYNQKNPNRVKTHFWCPPDKRAISFHYADPTKQRVMYYLIYSVNVNMDRLPRSE